MCPVSLGFKTPLDPTIHLAIHAAVEVLYVRSVERFVVRSGQFVPGSIRGHESRGRGKRSGSVVRSTWSVRGTAVDNTWAHRLESPIFFRELLDDEYERIRT